jgi:hypothetical protein
MPLSFGNILLFIEFIFQRGLQAISCLSLKRFIDPCYIKRYPRVTLITYEGLLTKRYNLSIRDSRGVPTEKLSCRENQFKHGIQIRISSPLYLRNIKEYDQPRYNRCCKLNEAHLSSQVALF